MRHFSSAGDDAVICVYAPSSLGGNLSDNIEHWQRVKLCRGHTFDSESPIIVWKLSDLGSKERQTHANVLCNPYKLWARTPILQ